MLGQLTERARALPHEVDDVHSGRAGSLPLVKFALEVVVGVCALWVRREDTQWSREIEKTMLPPLEQSEGLCVWVGGWEVD